MTDRLTIHDMLKLQTVREVDISHDGRRIACVVRPFSHPDAAPPGGRIWISEDGRAAHQATWGPGDDRLPCWSPDGRALAFLSDRQEPGLQSLFILDFAGDARPVGKIDGDAEALRWSADASRVLVLAADRGSDREVGQGATRIAAPDPAADPVVTRPMAAWRRLYSVEVETGRTNVVSTQGVNIWEFDWTGHGAVVAVVSSDPAESAWYDANLAVLDIDARRTHVVHDSNWQLQSPALSRDGRQVAFVEGLSSDRGHVAATVTILDLDTGEVTTVGDIDAVAVRWLESSRLFYVGPRGLETACGIMTRDGDVEKEWSGPVTLGHCHRWGVACNGDGTRFAAALEAPDQPPELVMMEMSGEDPHWTPLTRVNASLSGRCTSAVERRTWRCDDTEIEGLLVLPALATSDRLPLVVVVHGGPTNAWSYGFSHGYLHTGLLLAESGYAVLLPNPRGSAGRGSAFARMNIGDLGGCDLRDIIAGVTSLVEAGVAEPNRIGITGMSYGGYMSAWAPTQTRLFGASVTMATHTDWISFHYTANIASFDELFLAGDPRDPHGRHFHRSPVIHARDCASPMLILHGALDLCCPVGQAHEMYNALVEAGCETELVVYQRGGHSWAEDGYLVDTWKRTKAWFDRYLNA